MIRSYQNSDLDALKKMHKAQGEHYEFPDLSDEIWLSKLVLTNGDNPKMATLLRLTGEVYMLHDPSVEPVKSLHRFLAIHETARQDAKRRGLQDVFCWVPPVVEGGFSKVLNKLGWTKHSWPCYSLRLED